MTDDRNDLTVRTTGLLRLRWALTVTGLPTTVALTDRQLDEVFATMREAYRAAEARRAELDLASALAKSPSQGAGVKWLTGLAKSRWP